MARDGGRRVWQRQDVGLLQARGDCRRCDLAGELDAIGDAQPRRKRTHSLQIWFLFMAADDEPANVGHVRESLDQHVDAFPRVEVTGIADRHRVTGAGMVRDAAYPRPVGYHSQSRPRAKPFAQRAGEAGGNRHIPFSPLPDVRLTPRQPRQLRRAWCCRRGHQRWQRRCYLGRIAVRLVHERRPGGQVQDERRDRRDRAS